MIGASRTRVWRVEEVEDAASGGNEKLSDHWLCYFGPDLLPGSGAATLVAQVSEEEIAEASDSSVAGPSDYRRFLPFKGRNVVETYDPARWPYPREDAAEKEWDEWEE